MIKLPKSQYIIIVTEMKNRHSQLNREVKKMRVKFTDENLGVFIQKNRERNFDTERKMMIELLNALKGDTHTMETPLDNVSNQDLLPSGR